MKISELLAIQQSLSALSQLKLPVKVAYRISKGLKQLARLGIAVNKEQHELYRTMGELNEEGTQFVIPEDKTEAFNAAMQSILDRDEPFDFTPVSLDDLGGISIEPMHLAALDGIMLTDVPPAVDDSTAANE